MHRNRHKDWEEKRLGSGHYLQVGGGVGANPKIACTQNFTPLDDRALRFAPPLESCALKFAPHPHGVSMLYTYFKCLCTEILPPPL